MNVFVFKRISRLLVKSLFDFLAQHVNVSLIDLLALINKLYCVVNPYVLEFFRILVPELIQDEQKFLSSSGRKYWEKALPTSLYNLFHFLPKVLFTNVAVGMDTSPKGALRDQDINIGWRNFSLHDVPIFFATEVSCIENFHSINFDDEHGSSNDMPRHIRCNLDPIFFNFHSESHRTYARKRFSHIFL